MSSHSKGVVSQFDWGKTYIQGGDSGIVFSKKGSYRTAFMEAFPKIHGMGTFIRGEGDGIQAAEQQCWEIYQRMLNCKGHEWDRHVHGALREDGYAQCKHCKMCTSDALEPLTTCSVCDKPTKKTCAWSSRSVRIYLRPTLLSQRWVRVAEVLPHLRDPYTCDSHPPYDVAGLGIRRTGHKLGHPAEKRLNLGLRGRSRFLTIIAGNEHRFAFTGLTTVDHF